MVWGLYFGLLLTLEKFFLLKQLQKTPKIFSHIYALVFIMLGWVIFDFTDTPAMFAYLKSLFDFSGELFIGDARYFVVANLPLLIIAIFACLPIGRKLHEAIVVSRVGWIWENLCTLIILLLCTAELVNSTYNPFLYFRF